MKQKLCLLCCLLALWTGAGRLLGQQLIGIQYSQTAITYNLQAMGGVPISAVVNHPPGSNGKLPPTDALGFYIPATTNQFAGLLGFSGLTAPTNWVILNGNAALLNGNTAFSAPVAQAMGLPVGFNNGTVALVLQNVHIGTPFVAAPVSYNFGSIITPPANDVHGLVLTNPPSSYWQSVPWSASNHTNDPYYYSPNAGVVFATQPGQVNITWITAGSYTDVSPLNYVNPGGAAYPSFYTNGAYIYLLYTSTYIVSGTPVKPPQKMYWTENSFIKLGHPVSVANGRVTSVHVQYNTDFPAKVATPYQDPNYAAPAPATNTFQEYRTLWFDSTLNAIRAYNAQGRVFVELLGAPIPGANASQYLGFEIVDVSQAPVAANVTIPLGNPLTPYQDGFENASLTPAPIQNTVGTQFYYLQPGTPPTLYADKFTADPNDLQVYWLSPGVGGLLWPNLFVDYNLVWPADPAQYSYYLRPLVATPAQAALTAVLLAGSESPALDYQDPLDQTRGFMSAASQFYTWLSPAYPAHRSLLRFNSGNQVRFERVFSYLGQALQTNALFAGSVATNLTAWNPSNNTLTNYASGFNPPYATNLPAYVGQALTDPPGEIGSTNGTYGDYWAGYINTNLNNSPMLSSLNTNLGNSYDPYTYVDPFVSGFASANQGAIIPVNAIPGHNLLEVWWFRRNAADPVLGFQPVYWPSIIADYTIQWPANAPQIVMADNAGSHQLPSPQSSGNIYSQPDPTQPGFNPNEEHALMLAGTAYALRDDLNNTNPGSQFTSVPYALIGYTNVDGRPAMLAYQVRREAPEAGKLFDYIVNAGTQLQAPMPLPLMALPLAPNTNYPTGVTNFDTAPQAAGGDLPSGWNPTTDPSGPFSLYQGFTFQDRKHNFWVYRGPHAGLPVLAAGAYNTNSGNFDPLPAGTAVVGSNYNYYIHLSRLLPSLTVGASNLPPGLAILENVTNGLSISGIPTMPGTYTAGITIADTDGSSVSLPLSLTIVATGSVVALGPLAITSTNAYSGAVVTYNRPPALAAPPTPANSFTMRFYYKTQAGFDWPGVANPPPVGSIVPYLLPVQNGAPIGDATSSNTPSLNIVYRPVWPGLGADGQSPLPTLQLGQTLTTAINGLAAVRGQDSVEVLYQQSIATNAVLANTAASVVLFDPTVQKTCTLSAVPYGMLTDTANGLVYFPNLPPNLISRFWYDPNQQKLVLAGKFVPDPVNGNYVMLNVLSANDLAALYNLYPSPNTTENYHAWASQVDSLMAPVYTKAENPAVPGSYVINPKLTVNRRAADLVEVTNSDTAVDSYAMSATGPGQGYISYVVANGHDPKYTGDPITVYIARVGAPLFAGNLVVANMANASPFSQLVTFQHTADLAGRTGNYAYDWRIQPPVNGAVPRADESTWTPLPQTSPGPVFTLGAAGIQGLSDNYISMRYGYTNAATGNIVWSAWVNPILAQGWIKRVTENLDPIAGETQNLYNNPATTTASIISLAGARWDGNVPLNAASLTNNGLIQLYETVLNIGKSLSINSGINYGPANQALLLAAGYLNDFYTTLGNAAWANSLNPTIGFGTDNQAYGNIATSQFVFEGQESTLLEQNLALLRGRDDSLSPGVSVPPVYNHLWWNYTYGLAAGQVMYALNYNITDQNGDGVVNAADAQIMYPQGHGDAYGHYLTALMNYYELLMNPNFDWIPQSQAVTVLGATVAVNYQDEQKFAATSAALARSGRQVFDLTWRQDYVPGTAGGWNYFASNHVGQYTYMDNQGNTQPITRYWGMDHWASRVGQGTYLNWVVGNSILPPKDLNPNDQGIQIVDRTTVSDLQELPQTAAALQTDLNNANAGFTPLGLAQNAIPFDINPQQVTGANPQTHFDQIYDRAVQALNNAVVAFNAAQNVTQNLRQQQNSLTDLQDAANAQEQAYTDQLIELFGTPYPDDIGAGQTYPQGYTGPDLFHYMYVENPATNTFGGQLTDPTTFQSFKVDMQKLSDGWPTNYLYDFYKIVPQKNQYYDPGSEYVLFNIGADGFSKPASWTTQRNAVGSLQTAAGAVNVAQDKLREDLSGIESDKDSFDRAVALFYAQKDTNDLTLAIQADSTKQQQDQNLAQEEVAITTSSGAIATGLFSDEMDLLTKDAPSTTILGTAVGGDQVKLFTEAAALPINILKETTAITIAQANDELANRIKNFQNAAALNTQKIATNAYYTSLQNSSVTLAKQLSDLHGKLGNIHADQIALNNAHASYQALVAKGNRILMERQTFRQHTAAKVQGYTVANSAFLVFQNEDLERYNTLFDLAAKYAWMAASAYDYETGQLGTPAGKRYLNQIISSSALGVIQNGQPQISGTTTGDPGLANALAEMKADYDTLKGRLGFNNPDGYGTTVSLRSENYRINADSTGDNNWKQVLEQGLVPDLLADSDVRRNCLQIDNGSGAAVPGIELTFSTTITDGQNLFGQPVGPGDHAFSSSSFATKIFSLGVDLDGYVGMDNPVSNSGAGGTTPADPTLDPNGMSATPYVYLIPCGADSMRSPPLGDTSTIRTWNVDDVAIPLPFNIGASDFSDAPFYQAADSLSEPLFAVRKHQAFRPVSSLAAFNTSIYGATGALQPSQYTNKRLIGRSVWNSKWKLVIPGKTLLADPNQGLQRFINSVKDIHLYFVTYSYSGN